MRNESQNASHALRSVRLADPVQRDSQRAAVLHEHVGRKLARKLAHLPPVLDGSVARAPVDLEVGYARLAAPSDLAPQLLVGGFVGIELPPPLALHLRRDPEPESAPAEVPDGPDKLLQPFRRRAREGREPPRVKDHRPELPGVASGTDPDAHVPSVVEDDVHARARLRVEHPRPARALAEKHLFVEVLADADDSLVAGELDLAGLLVDLEHLSLRRPRAPVVRRRRAARRRDASAERRADRRAGRTLHQVPACQKKCRVVHVATIVATASFSCQSPRNGRCINKL